MCSFPWKQNKINAEIMSVPPYPPYRSATEYELREEQADAIVRTIAYHRKDYDRAVIHFSPDEHLNVRPPLSTPPQRDSSAAALGLLGKLPLELLLDVISRLDLHSLFRVQQLNVRSAQVVASLEEYQTVVSHGLDLLRSLLRTGLAATVSIYDCHDALCAETCELCGNFSGFMFLPTWTRICFLCIQWADETRVESLAGAKKEYRLDKTTVGLLSSVFKTLPGEYAMPVISYTSRVMAVSLHEVEIVSGRAPPTYWRLLPASGGRQGKFRYMASCILPYYNRQTGEVDYGVSCAGCQLTVDKESVTYDHELASDEAFDARDTVYGRDSFLEHFKWCKDAQSLWASTEHGTKRPTELPAAVRRGGYYVPLEKTRGD